MNPYCFDPYFRVFKNEPILHKPIFFTILKNGPILLNPYFHMATILLFLQKCTHIVLTHIFVFSKLDPYCIDPYFSNFQKYTHILEPIFFIWVHTFGPIFLIWVQKVQIWYKKLPMWGECQSLSI